MNIVIVGNVCIDKNKTEKIAYTGAGSPAMFMAKIFMQLPDVKLSIVAPYGKDFLPYASSISLWPAQPNVENTLVYENSIVNGTRTQKAFFTDTASNLTLTQEEINQLRQADIVVFAPLVPFPVSFVKVFTTYIPKSALRIFLPQGYFRDFVKNTVVVREFVEVGELLPFFEFSIVSDEDYPNIEKKAYLWTKSLSSSIIITKAEEGVVCVGNKQTVKVPTQPLDSQEIVDSVGAGDVFSAGFMYHFKKTNNLAESLSVGNAIARQSLFFASDEIVIDYSKATQLQTL